MLGVAVLKSSKNPTLNNRLERGAVRQRGVSGPGVPDRTDGTGQELGQVAAAAAAAAVSVAAAQRLQSCYKPKAPESQSRSRL